jgi:hypothetical protein
MAEMVVLEVMAVHQEVLPTVPQLLVVQGRQVV